MQKVVAEQILAGVDEAALWRRLITARDKKISLEALKYLTDRRDGKVAQTLLATVSEGPPTLQWLGPRPTWAKPETPKGQVN